MSNWTSHQVPPERDDNDLLSLSRKIETGFPSPASDHLEKALSLEELIVRRPTSTFYVRVEGHAMNASGIYEGDILVVDRSLSPKILYSCCNLRRRSDYSAAGYTWQ